MGAGQARAIKLGMTEATSLDVLARGWRGRVLAALIALVAALPGLLALPTVDRDEARFAQATNDTAAAQQFVNFAANGADRATGDVARSRLMLQLTSAAVNGSPVGPRTPRRSSKV